MTPPQGGVVRLVARQFSVRAYGGNQQSPGGHNATWEGWLIHQPQPRREALSKEPPLLLGALGDDGRHHLGPLAGVLSGPELLRHALR